MCRHPACSGSPLSQLCWASDGPGPTWDVELVHGSRVPGRCPTLPSPSCPSSALWQRWRRLWRSAASPSVAATATWWSSFTANMVSRQLASQEWGSGVKAVKPTETISPIQGSRRHTTSPSRTVNPCRLSSTQPHAPTYSAPQHGEHACFGLHLSLSHLWGLKCYSRNTSFSAGLVSLCHSSSS